MVDGALLQTLLSELLFSAGMNWFRNGLFRGSAWDWKQRDAQLTGNLKCVQSLTMAMQKLSILPFFCVWVPLLHPVSMDLNCYGHETAITSFSFFQARRLFAANEASVSCIGCSHRRSELKLVKVESATVPAVPKDSCVACWWRSRGWKPGTTAPQHVTWSSTEKDEPGSAVPGDLLPSKSRAVGPEDVLMAMPTLSKCKWKQWSATHLGTKKEWLLWRREVGKLKPVKAYQVGKGRNWTSIFHLFGELILDWLYNWLFFGASSGSAWAWAFSHAHMTSHDAFNM